MLRTRTNDTVEILDASKYFKEKDDLFVFEGISLDDLYKNNIIYFSKTVTQNGRPIINEGTYFYLDGDKTNSSYVSFDGVYATRITTAFSNRFFVSRNNFVTGNQFEELVRATPTDVRLIEDEGKLQLQLEHDSQVLSIDEDVDELLKSNFCTYTDVTSNRSATFIETTNKILFGEANELMEINDISTINTLFGENIIGPGGGRYTMIVASKIEYQHYATAKLCIMEFTQEGTSIAVQSIREIGNKMFMLNRDKLYFIKSNIVTDADTSLKVIEQQNYGLVSIN